MENEQEGMAAASDAPVGIIEGFGRATGGEVGRQRAAAASAIMQMLLWEAVVVAFWTLLNMALYRLTAYAETQGGTETCLGLVHRIGPWGVLILMILHLGRDIALEVKKAWREVRQG